MKKVLLTLLVSLFFFQKTLFGSWILDIQGGGVQHKILPTTDINLYQYAIVALLLIISCLSYLAISQKQKLDSLLGVITSANQNQNSNSVKRFNYLLFLNQITDTNKKYIFEKTNKFIDDNYSNKDLKIGQLSNLIHKTDDAINYTLNSITNHQFTFRDILHAKRMEQAAYLLINSDDKISYIAKKVGYTHTKFTPAFKAYYGVTPIKYRKQERMNESALKNDSFPEFG